MLSLTAGMVVDVREKTHADVLMGVGLLSH
jgi:hypothetical protein